MGLFNNQERMNRGQAMKATPSQPVQEIEMIVEYFDKTVSSSFGTGASMNFTSATPPFSINPRWVKKITYRTK